MRIAKRLTYPPSGYPWPHRVAGTLTADNLPVQGRKRVAALDRKTLFVGGTTISEPGGAFLFRGLPQLPPGHGGCRLGPVLRAHDRSGQDAGR